MKLIKIEQFGNGGHFYYSNEVVSKVPVGWAVIPDDMETPNLPYGDITVEDIEGVPTVTSWTARELPEAHPVPELGLKHSYPQQVVHGKYNKENPDALFIVGNGASDAERSNAFEVLKDGNVVCGGDSVVKCVCGTYVGTAGLITLAFDVIPDVVFIATKGESTTRTLFPTSQYAPLEYAVENNSITFTDSGKTTRTYYALYRADTILEKTSFYITVEVPYDWGSGLSRVDPKLILIQDGTTWAELIESSYLSYCGVGTTTGRVYWYVGYSDSYGETYSSYLLDSNGDYVLGTDIVKKGTYKAYTSYNGEIMMKHPPLA